MDILCGTLMSTEAPPSGDYGHHQCNIT